MASSKNKIYNWISLLRINQYTKNFFVLAPLFFSFKFMDTHLLYFALTGFLLFSITASCVYIINDITDMEDDRQHPVKSKRALVCGSISVNAAIGAVFILFAIAFTFSFFLANRLL
jgi:decaprenyl-phosphate phosphoribosyltransferase